MAFVIGLAISYVYMNFLNTTSNNIKLLSYKNGTLKKKAYTFMMIFIM